MLVQFAEKKDVRAYDLDVIEDLRNLVEGPSHFYDVAKVLLDAHPEDRTSIVSMHICTRKSSCAHMSVSTPTR